MAPRAINVADFSITEYKQAIAGMVAGMVFAIFGVDSYMLSRNPRPDPFTGTDAVELEERLREQMTFQHNLLDWNIRKDMPPENTRKRIKAIERCLERNCADFNPPTQDWQ